MRTQIEQLISKLADKSLTFGCLINVPSGGLLSRRRAIRRVVRTEYREGKYFGQIFCQEVLPNGNAFHIDEDFMPDEVIVLGHKILISDVLEKIRESDLGREEEMMKVAALLTYWRPFGFKTSLNEIYEKAEWEEEEILRATYASGHEEVMMAQVPKDPNTKALFQFLLQLSL